MKTRKVRKFKVADWRFLTTVVLVMLVVSGHHLLRRADAVLPRHLDFSRLKSGGNLPL